MCLGLKFVNLSSSLDSTLTIIIKLLFILIFPSFFSIYYFDFAHRKKVILMSCRCIVTNYAIGKFITMEEYNINAIINVFYKLWFEYVIIKFYLIKIVVLF